MEMFTDHSVEHLLRVLLGVVSLAGILWGAIRYMVRYVVNRSEDRTLTKITQVRSELRLETARARHTAETAEYRLQAHLRNEHPQLEARIRHLEGENRERT